RIGFDPGLGGLRVRVLFSPTQGRLKPIAHPFARIPYGCGARRRPIVNSLENYMPERSLRSDEGNQGCFYLQDPQDNQFAAFISSLEIQQWSWSLRPLDGFRKVEPAPFPASVKPTSPAVAVVASLIRRWPSSSIARFSVWPGCALRVTLL
ncbi:MAG TPA: hypothetical protein VLD66_04720, partial [Methyloceanibacter sp.]|nr:hypothetical protein [Methyloceanibacter sp.]